MLLLLTDLLLMTLIAVAPDKFSRGVGSPSAAIRPAPATYEQLELVDALERTYRTDAHLVGYILPTTNRRQPRLTKTAPQETLDSASFTTIFIDADNPGHAAWTDELLEQAIARYATAPLPFGVYHTAHGARFVMPLATPVLVRDAEPLIRRALSELDAAGLRVDWQAKDWTRHFRLPNVVRAGRPFRTPYMNLARMVPVTLEPLDIPARETRSRSSRRPAPPIPFTPTLADHWQARARQIGDVVRATVPPGTWHDLFLALAGSLLAKQVPPEHVPELVRLAAIAANSTNPPHHEKSARDTVTKYLGGTAVKGLRDLVGKWPSVADAVNDALADARTLHLREQTAAITTPASPLADTIARLEQTIAAAPDGLSVIVAECGLGKTAAAQRVAAARATAKEPTSSGRAPAQTKTAISVDKNELAEQIARDLTIPVRRLFGPLSVYDQQGNPVCKFHGKALPLVEGGQSVQWEFCLGRGKYKCPHYDECPAKDGYVDTGPSPRVTVGTHALLRELHAAAGATGLLVLDEPPPLLETMTITPEDIALALKNVNSFERRYAEAMTPVLLGLRDWEDPALTFDDLTDTLERPPTEDEEGRAITRPPLRLDAVWAARVDIYVARTLGAASRVLRALHRAMTNAEATTRLELEPTRIVITVPREDLAIALRREGACVAMDANADLHLPAFEKVVGYAPPVHRFVAEDGAPIERTILRCGSATRRSWLAHGRLVLDTGLLAALRGVASWAEACAITIGRPVKLGIITLRLVELALRAAFGDDVAHAWIAAKQSPAILTAARLELAALFESAAIAPGIALAHYGATRGLNRLKDVDCLATVGDPWGNVGDVQAQSSYLAIDDWEARLEAHCQAELEQAHGRLRTVHRRVPGFALHVGRVLPGGSGWKSPSVRIAQLVGGRPRAGAPMPSDELAAIVTKLGGVRATARIVGCAMESIRRYQAGRGVPPAVASELRRAAAIGVSESGEPRLHDSETPIKYISSSRGFGVTPGGNVASG